MGVSKATNPPTHPPSLPSGARLPEHGHAHHVAAAAAAVVRQQQAVGGPAQPLALHQRSRQHGRHRQQVATAGAAQRADPAPGPGHGAVQQALGKWDESDDGERVKRRQRRGWHQAAAQRGGQGAVHLAALQHPQGGHLRGEGGGL